MPTINMPTTSCSNYHNTSTSTSTSTSTIMNHHHPNSHPKRRRTRRRRRSNDSSSSSSSSSDSSTIDTHQHKNHPQQQRSKTSTTSSRSNRQHHHHHHHQSPRTNGHNAKEQHHQHQELDVDESLYVALDCEMVGVGIDGHRSMVARVTIIDWNGSTVLDEYIQPTEPITDYRTFVSGITPQDLFLPNNNGDDDDDEEEEDHHPQHQQLMTFEQCQKIVATIIENKIVIGHALKNDLRSLKLSHPWYMIRDTAKYEPFMKESLTQSSSYSSITLIPRKLCELTSEKLHRNIQITGKPHSPYEDAFAALELYKLVRCKWERSMTYKIQKTNEIQKAQHQQQEDKQQEEQQPALQEQQEEHKKQEQEDFPPLAAQ